MMNLPLEQVDCFVCTQTLNFIYGVPKAIGGAYKLLKENGIFLTTVSGIAQINRYVMDRWGDYWRFTDLSIRKMFKKIFGKGDVKIEILGNAFAAVSYLQGLAVEDLSDVSVLGKEDKNYQLIITIKAVKKC